MPPASVHIIRTEGVGMASRDGVLVADDEELIRALLGLALRGEGLRAWVAADGPEAVELFRQHQADVGVALLDVRMPGLDGPQALARMRELRPDLPCIFLTGYSGLYTEEELLALAR